MRYKNNVTFIIPPWVNIELGEYQATDQLVVDDASMWWFDAMFYSETYYKDLLESGWTPEKARSVLPNSLKTEIVATANFREWRHILKLRTSKAAHPQMREIMIPLRDELRKRIPIIFNNLGDE